MNTTVFGSKGLDEAKLRCWAWSGAIMAVELLAIVASGCNGDNDAATNDATGVDPSGNVDDSTGAMSTGAGPGGGGSEGSSGSPPSTTTDPGADSSGGGETGPQGSCIPGTMALTPGQSMTGLSFDFNGEIRDYALTVPSGYDPSQCTPLVVFLHGTSFDPDPETVEEHYILYGRWDETADAHNFLVAIPVGSKSGDHYWWEGADDHAFVAALVDSLIAEAGVDAKRVYATGFSAGGNFTVAALADETDRYAAFGVAGSGLQDPFFTPPQRKAGVYIFIGSEDEYDWVGPATALHEALLDAGWTEGENVIFNERAGWTHEYDSSTNEAQWALFSNFVLP